MTKSENFISVILIGCGAVSKFHYAPAIRSISEKENIDVVALVDPDTENVSLLARSFPKADVFSKLEGAHINKKCLAIVASPPVFHKEQTIYCLGKGASVLCEKPMAANVAEAEAMVKFADEARGLLAIGFSRRFFSSSKTVQELIRGNALGRLIHFSIDEGGKFSWEAASDSLFRRSLTPGGVFYDIGSHVLDLLSWWLGDPDAVDYYDDAMGGLEANCMIKLAYPSGISGTVRLSRDWETQNRYTFGFEKGSLTWIAAQANKLIIKLNSASELFDGELYNFQKLEDKIYIKKLTSGAPQGLMDQLMNVARSIRGEEKLFIPAKEGLRSMRLIELCYKKRQLMRMPWLTGDEAKKAEILAKG